MKSGRRGKKERGIWGSGRNYVGKIRGSDKS
jgi:hypothetical protein